MPDNQFHHIGIINRYGTQEMGLVVQSVISILRRRRIPYIFDYANAPRDLRESPLAIPIKEWSSDIDLAIVLGGDGTFLYAGRSLQGKNIPIVGINAGHLGFLADLNAREVETELNEILDGNCVLEQRRLLAVRVESPSGVRAYFYAVNDVVMNQRTRSRMVELDVYARREFLCNYHADGLIIATPTGSTAYMLSAGGPILAPTMDAFIIAPICPHSLTHRPVVFDNHCEVKIVPRRDRRQEIQVSIDGQEDLALRFGDTVVVGDGGEFTVLHPQNYSFQRRLREKLRWGIPPAEE
ncbi:MAG: NAD(+)/NADH kinase [Cardiobacteriaceae bacterium]|nr:NAD(+)/NADH kinase [Cardiobacteriaceae bacterium]